MRLAKLDCLQQTPSELHLLAEAECGAQHLKVSYPPWQLPDHPGEH